MCGHLCDDLERLRGALVRRRDPQLAGHAQLLAVVADLLTVSQVALGRRERTIKVRLHKARSWQGTPSFCQTT